MKYLAQVQQGIDYLEEQLPFEPQTADVARHAGISHWHFQRNFLRNFKALTNETLKTYIPSRRLAGALEMLLSTRRASSRLRLRPALNPRRQVQG